jgi:hypothetical protein
VAAVVGRLASTSVTRRRYATGSLDAAGVWTDGAATDTTIAGVMQRPSPAVRRIMPEAVRAAVRWIMHTAAAVRGADETSGNRADQIIHGADVFECVTLADWSEHGNYRRIALVRVED